MKELLLHIGPHKTGTSTIQRFIHENRPQLRDAGVLVLNPSRNSAANAVRKGHLDSLLNAAAKADCDRVLLSGEGLSIFEGPSIAHLRNATKSFNARVIFYYRRQDKWLYSFWNQWVKVGRTKLDFREWAAERIGSPEGSQLAMLDRWSEGFGKEAIIFRNFESLKDGDLVADFLDAIGLNHVEGFRPVERLNESIPHANAILNLTVTRALDDEMVGRLSLSRLLCDHLNKAFDGSTDGGLPAADRDWILVQSEEENAAISARFYGGRPLFSHEPTPTSAAEPLMTMIDDKALRAVVQAVQAVIRDREGVLEEREEKRKRRRLRKRGWRELEKGKPVQVAPEREAEEPEERGGRRRAKRRARRQVENAKAA